MVSLRGWGVDEEWTGTVYTQRYWLLFKLQCRSSWSFPGSFLQGHMYKQPFTPAVNFRCIQLVAEKHLHTWEE